MLPLLLIVVCTIFRIIPHPPNIAPVGATAVFAGRTMRPWAAFGVVALSMIIGDAILAQVHGYAMVSRVTPFVYAGFFVQTLLGRWLRSRRGGAIGAAFLGSVAFFGLSNLGVWAVSGRYAPTIDGLVACYLAAIPFFGGTLLGDVVWTVILSSAYRPLARRLERYRTWVPVSTRELALV